MRTILLSVVLTVLGTQLQAQTEYINVSSLRSIESILHLSNDFNDEEHKTTLKLSSGKIAHVLSYTDTKVVINCEDPFFFKRVICINDDCQEVETDGHEYTVNIVGTRDVVITIPMHNMNMSTNR